MFFVIPEMPSKTFVMVKKKLPDHFKEYISVEHFESQQRFPNKKTDRERCIISGDIFGRPLFQMV